MSKRDKKRKQKQHHDSGGASSGGGVMSSLRGGFQNMAGGKAKGPRTPAQKAWDILFWVLLVAAIAFFFSRRFG